MKKNQKEKEFQKQIKRLKNKYHPETFRMIELTKAIPWPIKDDGKSFLHDIAEKCIVQK